MEEAPLIHTKYGPKIRELMVKLEEYQKKVKRLQEEDTNLDDEDESSFIQLGKYKKRILQIHSRLAKLQECDDPTRRQGFKCTRFLSLTRF